MKFNKKIFNRAAWITLLLTYVLPYRYTDGFATKFGYPFPFLTIYDTELGITLLNSVLIHIPSLALDLLIVYLVLYFIKVKRKESS